ncbi:TetR family transcriptional regulator [Ferrovibrio sp.]|uniref:TetR family transcriptional regulator n=1 Tax=Ferrovibrio sp. TaxID=1917215 RepID=UPI003D2D797F
MNESRRLPTQRRSRERVERLLGVSRDLIAAQGSEALRMSDVAQQAGVSIGSLYQYFPDKAAIIRALAERYNQEGRACVGTALQAVATAPALGPAMEQITDTYYAMFLAEPAMRDIWSGTQADKALQDMDLEDGRWHAACLAGTLRRLVPNIAGDIETRAFLLMYLLCSSVRLAVAMPREAGDALLAAFKQVLRREVAALLS